MSTHCLLFGGDHASLADDLRRRIRDARQAGQDVTRINLASEADGLDAVLRATCEMSLLASERVIVAEGAETLSAKDITTPVRDALANTPPGVTILFVARDSKQARCPKALKDSIAAAGGSVTSLAPLSARDAPHVTVEMAAAIAGMRISHDDARSLAEGCRNSRAQIRSRIEQLAVLGRAGVHTIDAHSVTLVTGDGEHKMWGVIDALSTGNPAALLAEYQELAARGADGGVLTVAIRAIEELAGTAALLSEGLSPKEIAECTGKHQFTVDKRTRSVQRTTAPQIATALRLLAAGEHRARGGSHLTAQTVTAVALHDAATALGHAV